MSGDVNEEALRVGLSLYQMTLVNGQNFFRIYDLVFDQQGDSRRPFWRIFRGDGNFWAREQQIARFLESCGMAVVQRRRIEASAHDEISLKLTSFGKALFSLAYVPNQAVSKDIEGLSLMDVASVLRNETLASQLGREIEALEESYSRLNLNNYQRSIVSSYNSILIIICNMPEPDYRMFWNVLERLNNFAGVASLIVALIALKLSQ